MCATEPRILAWVSAFSLVDDLFDVLLGDLAEASNAAVGRLVEQEVILLRGLDVHNADRSTMPVVLCVVCDRLVRTLIP